MIPEAVAARSSTCDSTTRYRYRVYGLTLISDTPFALPGVDGGGLAQVEFRTAQASVFRQATSERGSLSWSDGWFQHAVLLDGSSYVRWDGVGEFLVSGDGRHISGCQAEQASSESFQVYMLGQALSFALVKQGFEPLHATAVVVGDRTVAFLGTSGAGKSTLAACFLEAGHRLLTDDLLMLEESNGRIVAYPGPPRLKLFPEVAYRFLGEGVTGSRMNLAGMKVVVPMSARRLALAPQTLDALYSIVEPDDVVQKPMDESRVGIDQLSPRDAFLEITRSTFNYRLTNPARLERQFSTAASLQSRIPIKRLAYPRALGRLHETVAAVIADLARERDRPLTQRAC
jgi:hypothetical protein